MKSFRLLAFAFAILASSTVFAQEKFDGTFGWNYSHNDQGPGSANLNGWDAQFSYWTNDNLAYVFEIENFYGSFRGRNASEHDFIFGPRYTFGDSEQTLRPLVYVQAGLQRSMNFGDADYGPRLQVGGGASYKLNDRFSLQLVPLEYSLARVGGSARNNYNAKFGITFTFKER